MADERKEVIFRPIGFVRSPYKKGGFTPFQPLEREEGKSQIELFPEYAPCLDRLADFNYVIVLFYAHETDGEWTPKVKPPWAKGAEVGLFASRSPRRPNCIGHSIARLRGIEGNVLHLSALDAFDGTPVLDIKPYIKGLDDRADANAGWIEEMDGHDHLLQHIRGVPHDHGHDHDHDHSHGHDHHHDHDGGRDRGHKHDHHHGHEHDDE